jgi:hypothetical protein
MANRTPSQQAALDRRAALEQQVRAAPRTFRVLTGDRPTGSATGLMLTYPVHADEIGNRGAGLLKQQLSQAINELLRPVRRRRAGLAEDASYLDSVLDTGNRSARQLADNTLTKAHDHR